MARLPYGTSKFMTPEERHERKLMLLKRYRDAHREEINAKNKRFFDRWRVEKPFLVDCYRCGKEFNAARRERRMCPDCWAELHANAAKRRELAQKKREAKSVRDSAALQMYIDGYTQTEIAVKLGVCQKTISNICIRNGIKTPEVHKRKGK